MSVEAMSAVFKHSASKGCTRLVLLALANEANGEGLVSAYRRSQNYLAAQANVDEQTVRRAIVTLVKLGELVRTNKGEGRQSSDYRIRLYGLGQVEGVQDVPPALSECPPREDNANPLGVQDVPPIIPLLPVDSPLLPVGRSPAKRKTQLPDNFNLNDERFSRALAAGMVSVEAEFVAFRNYHQAHGSVMANWDAAWRTWIGNANRWRSGGSKTVANGDAEVAAALAKYGGTA